MSDYDKDHPHITIAEHANPKALSVLFFGLPIACIILSIPFPFFRHIFTFGSFIVTLICCFAVYAAYEDKNNGVKRSRPIKEGFTFPKWFKPTFFLVLILGSAGLRLGFYIVPVLWLINWICLVSFQSHLEATYPPKEEKDV